MEEARSQQQQARQDWDRAQVLYKNDDISTAQFDQYRARVDAPPPPCGRPRSGWPW